MKKINYLFFHLAAIMVVTLFSQSVFAGCERNEIEGEIRHKYGGRVHFASSQYNVLQAIPIAVDAYFFGGTISYEWVKNELRDMGINGARFLAESRFNPATEEVIGDVMTFRCYERPFLPLNDTKIYGPNIFVPYIALRSKNGIPPHSDTDTQPDNVNCGSNIELRPGSNNLNFQKGQSWSTCSGYRFVFQNDANLVLYRPDGHPVWATGTNGTGADNFAVQSDGNVVLYDHGRPVWATNTNGRGRFFAIQTDGNLVVYTSSGRPVWASNTHSGRSGSRNASGNWR